MSNMTIIQRNKLSERKFRVSDHRCCDPNRSEFYEPYSGALFYPTRNRKDNYSPATFTSSNCRKISVGDKISRSGRNEEEEEGWEST